MPAAIIQAATLQRRRRSCSTGAAPPEAPSDRYRGCKCDQAPVGPIQPAPGHDRQRQHQRHARHCPVPGLASTRTRPPRRRRSVLAPEFDQHHKAGTEQRPDLEDALPHRRRAVIFGQASQGDQRHAQRWRVVVVVLPTREVWHVDCVPQVERALVDEASGGIDIRFDGIAPVGRRARTALVRPRPRSAGREQRIPTSPAMPKRNARALTMTVARSARGVSWGR